MLHAGGQVVIQIFFDLAFLLAFGRLVDGKLDPSVAVGHHLGHQGRVFGGDVLVVEVQQLAEAHHLVVEIDPVIHLPKLDVADHMVDGSQPGRFGGFVLDFAIGGGKRPVVVRAVNENVLSLSISVNGRSAEDAVLILLFARCPGRLATAFGGRLPGLFHIIHFQGDDLDPVAVQHVVRSQRAGWAVRRRDNKTNLPGL